MALDKTGLKNALQAIFTDITSGKTAADAADDFANAIDTYVKTGTVSFGAGDISGNDAPSGDSHNNLTANGGTIS